MILATTPGFAGEDLYYLVIDRSGSIMGSNLDAPIEKAVSDEINTLPETTELRVVFFGNEALGRRTWESLDLRAKADFQRHFQELFSDYFAELRERKRDGEQTDLFDTVGSALEEVNRDNSILQDTQKNPGIFLTAAKKWTNVYSHYDTGTQNSSIKR